MAGRIRYSRGIAILAWSSVAVAIASSPLRLHSQTPGVTPAQGRGRGAANVQNFTAEQRRLVEAAVPSQTPAKPSRPRRLLIMTRQTRDGTVTTGPSYFALPAMT